MIDETTSDFVLTRAQDIDRGLWTTLELSPAAAAKVPAGRVNAKIDQDGQKTVYMRVVTRRRLKNGWTRLYVEFIE